MRQAKILGIFGVYPQIPPFFGAGDGDGAFEDFGDASGTGNPQILGFFWGKSPKIPNFRGGEGERILGIFTTLVDMKVIKTNR